MHDFVGEDVAIDAEEAMAGAAFVSAAFAHAVGDDVFRACWCWWRRARGGSVFGGFLVGSVDRGSGSGSGPGGSFGGEGGLAAEAGALGGSISSLPGDFGPVLEREEMVVATGEVGAQDQGEFACGARGRERAHFAAASGAEVSAAGGA